MDGQTRRVGWLASGKFAGWRHVTFAREARGLTWFVRRPKLRETRIPKWDHRLEIAGRRSFVFHGKALPNSETENRAEFGARCGRANSLVYFAYRNTGQIRPKAAQSPASARFITGDRDRLAEDAVWSERLSAVIPCLQGI